MNTGNSKPARLTLQPMPDTVPALVRLRRAFKCLLRSFGLRHVKIEAAGLDRSDPPADAEKRAIRIDAAVY